MELVGGAPCVLLHGSHSWFHLLTGLSVASCWIGGSAGRWIGRSVAVRARGCGGDVLGLLVGSRRVAHAQRPRDEDDREVGQ